MKRNKLTAIIAMLIAAMFLVSACGGGNTASSGTTAAAATEAATTAEATTTAATTAEETTKAVPAGDVLVRTNFTAGEFTDEIIEQCEKDLPGIKVERAEADDTKLMAMIAAGTAPDVIRIYAAQTLPMWVTRNICASIQDYVDASPYIDESDLLPICDTCRWDGKKSGQGPLYGIPKDWSLDITVMINKKQFEKMGVAIPDEKVPLTIAQYVDLSNQLYEENDDGTTKVFGSGDSLTFNLMLIQSMLNQQGKSIWSDDYRSVSLNNNEVKEIFKYIYDCSMSKTKVSKINPAPDWDGNIFREGMLGIFQVGYWYSGVIRGFNQTETQMDIQTITQEDCMMLPALMINENATRISTCTHACSGILLKQSKNPDEAWKVFEWFLGAQQPAKDRAMGGWGLPAYRSMMDLLPSETDFDKQCLRVTMDEIDKSAQLYVQMNPFVNYAAAESLITKYIDPIYFGEATIEDALPQLERDIQLLIEEGIDIAGID
jgi:multiple sugar transport system substrate-binding protein